MLPLQRFQGSSNSNFQPAVFPIYSTHATTSYWALLTRTSCLNKARDTTIDTHMVPGMANINKRCRKPARHFKGHEFWVYHRVAVRHKSLDLLYIGLRPKSIICHHAGRNSPCSVARSALSKSAPEPRPPWPDDASGRGKGPTVSDMRCWFT